MSTNIDATLFYGFLLENADGETPNLPWWEEYDGDDEKCYLNRMGLADPTAEEYAAYRNPWFAYWEHANPLLDQRGGRLIMHCSDEYPMYAVAAWSLTASYGDPEPLTSADLTIKPEWDDGLRSYCKLMDIPYVTPGWYLVSYRG